METVTVADRESCLYLYAVVDSCAPVPDELEGTLISRILFRDIACAATKVSSADYCTNLPSNTSEQLLWVTPRAMKHHHVLMEMMTRSTVVPFKFGTLCASVDDIQTMLATNYERFKTLLEQLREREEWVVSIYVDQLALLKHLETTQQQLQEMDSVIAQKAGGEAYLLRKKKHRLTSELLENALQLMRDQCRQSLLRASVLVVDNSLLTPSDGAVPVMSLTVLSRSTEFEFLRQIAFQIENDYAHYSASVTLSGPWPPYGSANSPSTPLSHKTDE